MEDNKDFDKDKQETGTQQMPHVPTEGEEDEKKGTIVLFGHEFDKKKAVMAGLGGLLAIALIGGGVWYAASQKPEPKEPTPIEQTEKTEQHVIQLGAKANGWVKGESSPVIAHIVNKEEKVDYYHAYDANEPHALDVPAEGEYEVSFISPVDKDGSIYEVPKTAKVKSEAEDKDGKGEVDELTFEFKPIAADKADAPSGGNAGASKPETGGNSTSSGNGGSTGNGGNSGSNGGGGSTNGDGGSKPQHVHNWVPQTTVVHHEAQVQTVHHDAVYGTGVECNGCFAQFNSYEAWLAHSDSQLDNGNNNCMGYHTIKIVLEQAWDETIEVSPAWDETVTTGYTCSCGAVK